MTGCLATTGYLAASYVIQTRLVAQKDTAVQRAESINADLQDYIAALQDQLAATARDLGQSQDKLSSISGQSGALRGMLYSAEAKIKSLEDARSKLTQQRSDVEKKLEVSEEQKAGKVAQLNKSLDQTTRELHQAEAQRVTLATRLTMSEADLAEAQQRQNQLKNALDESVKKLQQLGTDRDKALGERDKMKAKIGELEQKLSMREADKQRQLAMQAARPAPAEPSRAAPQPSGAPDTVVASARPELKPDPQSQLRAEAERELQRFAALVKPAAPTEQPTIAAVAPPPMLPPAVAAPAPAVIPVAAVVAPVPPRRQPLQGAWHEIERVLASSGVDVNRLFSEFGVDRGVGGPFVPLPKGAVSGADRKGGLDGLLKALPLGAPIDDYRLASRFGARSDPFNGHSSFHTGLDFAAPYMTPIYATAPGVVTFAGYRPDYGKIVEIDHGNGIMTRYGHMHRAIVSVGQSVPAHTQIGFIGSTGRSSGPHCHYEVVVNGEAQDPEKFLNLARVVPASATR